MWGELLGMCSSRAQPDSAEAPTEIWSTSADLRPFPGRTLSLHHTPTLLQSRHLQSAYVKEVGRCAKECVDIPLCYLLTFQTLYFLILLEYQIPKGILLIPHLNCLSPLNSIVQTCPTVCLYDVHPQNDPKWKNHRVEEFKTGISVIISSKSLTFQNKLQPRRGMWPGHCHLGML